MFKSARWRSEKNKFKELFKLQFHASQVSQLGVDALWISVVPAHVGKPTVRLGKSNIQDGKCYWEHPVYETVKFVRESKTGKIKERIYHFVIGKGSSKTGIVGEASVDFAKYAEATKVCSVALRLKDSKSEAILHVSLQRIVDSVDESVVDETGTELDSLDGNFGVQVNYGDAEENIRSNLSENLVLNGVSSHIPELNGNQRASGASDFALSRSGSNSTLDTLVECRKMNTDSQQNVKSFLSLTSSVSLTQTPTTDVSKPVFKEHHRTEWDWLGDSVPDASTDDSSGSLQGSHCREIPQENSEVLVAKLQTKLAVLERQAEVSELELQTLRKQVVKESKRWHDLSRELLSLKEERDVLKDECEKYIAPQKQMDKAKAECRSEFKVDDPWDLVQELRKALNHEKGISGNLQMQLQQSQKSITELILAMNDLKETLEQKNIEIVNLSSKVVKSGISDELHATNLKYDMDDDEEQRELEVLVRQHHNAEEADMLEQKVMDLNGVIEIYRRGKDEIEVQMEQLALDYEILKQENHDMSYKLEQCQLQEELKMQYECSYSNTPVNDLEVHVEGLENEIKERTEQLSKLLFTVSELEAQVENLEKELEDQARGFESNLEALMHAKIEQEQRAIRAEETLRKIHLSNIKTAEGLQEELKRLSMKVIYICDTNEKLALRKQLEAKELRQHKRQLEEMLQEAVKEKFCVREAYEQKMQQLSSQITSNMKLIEQMQFDHENMSMQLEYQRNHNEEAQKLLSDEVLMLKSEIKRLKEEKNILSCHAKENATLRANLEEMRKQIDTVNAGTVQFENTVVLLKKELEEPTKEFNITRNLKKEKELDVETSPLEMSSKNHTPVSDSCGTKETVNLNEEIEFFEACEDTREFTMNGETNGKIRNQTENFGMMAFMGNKNGSGSPLVLKSDMVAKEELKTSVLDLINQKELDITCYEMVAMKEKNEALECELKEMQFRYSDISLKFAEVEGERQQLKMKLRNLISSKKYDITIP